MRQDMNRFSCILLAGFALVSSLNAADWTMLGRDAARNAVSSEKSPPLSWTIETESVRNRREAAGDKVSTARNIKWTAPLGLYNYGSPVVANGLVWIGTSEIGDAPKELANPGGLLKCFRERDGKLLYQRRTPPRETGHNWHDGFEGSGMGAAPLVEGDRLWYVTNRWEVVCLDLRPLAQREAAPRELWTLDMPKQLGVDSRATFMGPNRTCSLSASHQGRLYVVTGNSCDRLKQKVPAPQAPSLVCLDKETGKVLWSDHSPGENILETQMSSPLVIEVAGQPQVIVPQGDGWLRSFDAGGGKLLWEFDVNPKATFWDPLKEGSSDTKSAFFTTPVYYDGRVYVALGRDSERGDCPGRLCCIDPTKRGDVSSELAVDKAGKPLARRRSQAISVAAGERAIANPNSALIWESHSTSSDFKAGVNLMTGSVVADKGLLIAADSAGLVHCLDAKTGRRYWRYDAFARIHSSPLIVDDYVYVADEEGDVMVFRLSADPQAAMISPPKDREIVTSDPADMNDREPIAVMNMQGSVDAPPIFANGTLFLASRSLYAIAPPNANELPK
jgi:outer membrane protein assembly factor BamB